MEKLVETHGPGIVKTSDIARLMELFQVRWLSKIVSLLVSPSCFRVHSYVIGSSTRKSRRAQILQGKRKLMMPLLIRGGRKGEDYRVGFFYFLLDFMKRLSYK